MQSIRFIMFKILTACPLFRGMTADRIRQLLGPDTNYTVTPYKKGETIARKDTAYSGLMILLRGGATGQVTDRTGRTIRIDALEAPQLIAPACLFGGYNRLRVDVIAATDAEILTLHRGMIFEMMQEDVLVLSNFVDIISNRANVWSKKIYLLSYKSLKEKVAHYLLDHTTAETPNVAVPSIPEIAEYFGATRSATLTVLEGLEKKQIIRLGKDQIGLLNRSALEEMLNRS